MVIFLKFVSYSEREAPEVVEGHHYSTPADVYSFGMVLYEMSTGREPFPNIKSLSQLKQVMFSKMLHISNARR